MNFLSRIQYYTHHVLQARTRVNKDQRGQASILFALTFITLFIFFTFVVNIGLIVHYKINLQQTADLAAYAGASWQARALNAIALENYRMRQDYKEYVFHTWVNYSRFQNSWANFSTPNGITDQAGTSAMSPDGFSPLVCLVAFSAFNVDQLTNYCQKLIVSQSGVAQVDLATDPVMASLQAELTALGQNVSAFCSAAGVANSQFHRALQDKYVANAPDARGLLWRRADHIENLVNQFNAAFNVPPGEDVITSPIDSTAIRSVRATVRANLAPDVYAGLERTTNCSGCGVVMLSPQDAPAAANEIGSGYLKLGKMLYRFSSGYATFIPQDNTGTCAISPKVNCTNKPGEGAGFDTAFATRQERDRCPAPATDESVNFNTGFVHTVPTGFFKVRETVTYVALVMHSQPKLLYLPQSWSPILTAYAAAMPFGGRLGPDPTSAAFQNTAEFKYNMYKYGRAGDQTGQISDLLSDSALDTYAFPQVAFYPSDPLGYGDPDRRVGVAGLYTPSSPECSGQYNPATVPNTVSGHEACYPGFYRTGVTRPYLPGGQGGDYRAFENTGAPYPDGDPARWMMMGIRGPTQFDTLMFSIFPNYIRFMNGGSFSTPVQMSTHQQLYLNFPPGAHLEFPEAASSTEVRYEHSHILDPVRPAVRDATAGAPALTAIDRPLGTETIMVNEFTDVLGGITTGPSPIGPVKFMKQIFSSWAPDDERVLWENISDPNDLNTPGAGRTGYSVKITNIEAFLSPSSGIISTEYANGTGVAIENPINTSAGLGNDVRANLDSGKITH